MLYRKKKLNDNDSHILIRWELLCFVCKSIPSFCEKLVQYYNLTQNFLYYFFDLNNPLLQDAAIQYIHGLRLLCPLMEKKVTDILQDTQLINILSGRDLIEYIAPSSLQQARYRLRNSALKNGMNQASEYLLLSNLMSKESEMVLNDDGEVGVATKGSGFFLTETQEDGPSAASHRGRGHQAADSNIPKNTIPVDGNTELELAEITEDPWSNFEGLQVERLIRERSHAKIPYHSPMEYELKLPDIDEFKYYSPKTELLNDPFQDFVEADRLEHIDTINVPRQDIIVLDDQRPIDDQRQNFFSQEMLERLDQEVGAFTSVERSSMLFLSEMFFEPRSVEDDLLDNLVSWEKENLEKGKPDCSLEGTTWEGTHMDSSFEYFQSSEQLVSKTLDSLFECEFPMEQRSEEKSIKKNKSPPYSILNGLSQKRILTVEDKKMDEGFDPSWEAMPKIPSVQAEPSFQEQQSLMASTSLMGSSIMRVCESHSLWLQSEISRQTIGKSENAKNKKDQKMKRIPLQKKLNPLKDTIRGHLLSKDNTKDKIILDAAHKSDEMSVLYFGPNPESISKNESLERSMKLSLDEELLNMIVTDLPGVLPRSPHTFEEQFIFKQANKYHQKTQKMNSPRKDKINELSGLHSPRRPRTIDDDRAQFLLQKINNTTMEKKKFKSVSQLSINVQGILPTTQSKICDKLKLFSFIPRQYQKLDPRRQRVTRATKLTPITPA